MVRRKRIRQIVENILEQCDIDEPPIKVHDVAKKLGVVVQQAEAPDKLSGFLHRPAGASEAVVGVNSAHSRHRKRFTIAHELGHFLLHADQEFHIDESFPVYRRDDRSAEGVDRTEIEANVFAAELLMPAGFLARDLREQEAIDLSKEDELDRLAKRYQVSPQAMTFRLANLGYLTL
jgi:Zn-dependent peptidase ImmA (M78 family)